MDKIELAYNNYLLSRDEKEKILSRSEFLDRLKIDTEFNKKFGRNITTLMPLDERLQIAYPDKEERIETLVFMGTKSMKTHLNKLNIPKRKIIRPPQEIKEFLSQKNKT